LTNETLFDSKEIQRMREKIKKKLALQKTVVEPKQQKKCQINILFENLKIYRNTFRENIASL